MKSNLFGNLMDWWPILDTLIHIKDEGDISRYQPGLIRILRYRGNWRLREEALKIAGQVQTPSKGLVHQVVTILNDDNIYYEARILAGNALIEMLNNSEGVTKDDLFLEAFKIVEELRNVPQPPIFDEMLVRLYSKLAVSCMLENLLIQKMENLE